MHHKDILYGKQSGWTKTGIIVEGVTDVWRLGKRSCAVFGIEYKINQIKIMIKNFKRIIILFDNDIQAQRKAKELQAQLRLFGKDTWIEKIEDDPGSMNDLEAQYLINQIY